MRDLLQGESKSSGLLRTDVERFRDDGLIVASVRLSAETNAAMRTSLDRLLAFRDDVSPESLICPHIPALGRDSDDEAIELASARATMLPEPFLRSAVHA